MSTVLCPAACPGHSAALDDLGTGLDGRLRLRHCLGTNDGVDPD